MPLVAWVVLAPLYLLFVGEISAHEAMLAALCGGVAAGWFTALRHVGSPRFRFQRAMLGAAGRAVGQLPGAAAAVAAAIVRGRCGYVAEQHFLHGRDTEPADASRRAAVLLAVSLAPDRFALRLPEHEDRLVLHTMQAPKAGKSPKTGKSPDPRWPT